MQLYNRARNQLLSSWENSEEKMSAQKPDRDARMKAKCKTVTSSELACKILTIIYVWRHMEGSTLQVDRIGSLAQTYLRWLIDVTHQYTLRWTSPFCLQGRHSSESRSVHLRHVIHYLRIRGGIVGAAIKRKMEKRMLSSGKASQSITSIVALILPYVGSSRQSQRQNKRMDHGMGRVRCTTGIRMKTVFARSGRACVSVDVSWSKVKLIVHLGLIHRVFSIGGLDGKSSKGSRLQQQSIDSGNHPALYQQCINYQSNARATHHCLFSSRLSAELPPSLAEAARRNLRCRGSSSSEEEAAAARSGVRDPVRRHPYSVSVDGRTRRHGRADQGTLPLQDGPPASSDLLHGARDLQRSQPDAGDTDVGRFLGGCYIHLKMEFENICHSYELKSRSGINVAFQVLYEVLSGLSAAVWNLVKRTNSWINDFLCMLNEEVGCTHTKKQDLLRIHLKQKNSKNVLRLGGVIFGSAVKSQLFDSVDRSRVSPQAKCENAVRIFSEFFIHHENDHGFPHSYVTHSYRIIPVHVVLIVELVSELLHFSSPVFDRSGTTKPPLLRCTPRHPLPDLTLSPCPSFKSVLTRHWSSERGDINRSPPRYLSPSILTLSAFLPVSVCDAAAMSKQAEAAAGLPLKQHIRYCMRPAG
ncbi:hypothetical protein F2P81_013400 [Scophthalmus maximus]|uniref:Uncharacterized protein n=1 Tax=Scophthalmus maximus TaxID=52904 RepID=A0A6A4SQN6_SCOMX|nr:hypothetical protein F2P81_013400 [Scophthalmus maximus]